MENFYSRLHRLKTLAKLPAKQEINSVFYSFSRKEKAVFLALFLVLSLSVLLLLERVNQSFMVTAPVESGSISEGIVGAPRFINPVLASSPVDSALSSLIYSGLMRKGENGNLFPDLAEKYEVSKNGLTYTFTLRDKIYFQDGKPVTVNDIIFTIEQAKDAIIKSPQRVNWSGISVEKADEKTIKFILKQPYASFLENTTIGILPAHIWEGSPLELGSANVNPIGSGPFMVKNVDRESTGVINSYELAPFGKFILGEPYIESLSFHFYPNEEELLGALEGGEVDQISGVTPANAETLKEKGYRVESVVLPRVFGLFFNQNQNQLFTDKTVLSAIESAIDKERIVAEVLGGYGVVISGPIPPNMVEYQRVNTSSGLSREEILKKVEDKLAKAGWKRGADGFLEKTKKEKKKSTVTKLEFSISTGNVDELTKAAELVREELAKVGIKVNVKTFETGNLNQSVIRPRKYEALLFGEIINHEGDLFAFWHSSQRKDPGLNVAMYTNAKVDKILEDAFITIDAVARVKKYQQFEDEVKKDVPAVFLYSPKFIYVVSKDLKELEGTEINAPADRYLNAYAWYRNTEDVWKIFAPN